MSHKVNGFCPMGCGETLIVGDNGDVMCLNIKCPDAEMVTKVLTDPETEHVAKFTPEHFVLKHPLKERGHIDEMEGCGLHTWLSGLGGPPVPLGNYRAIQVGPEHWNFEPLPEGVG
jgi:hypothetical protein